MPKQKTAWWNIYWVLWEFGNAGFKKFVIPVIPKLALGEPVDIALYISFTNTYGRGLVRLSHNVPAWLLCSARKFCRGIRFGKMAAPESGRFPLLLSSSISSLYSSVFEASLVPGLHSPPTQVPRLDPLQNSPAQVDCGLPIITDYPRVLVGGLYLAGLQPVDFRLRLIHLRH